MNGDEIPAALAFTAYHCVRDLRELSPHPLASSDLRIEITFTPDALSVVVAQRPAILKLDRLAGIDVYFPERAMQRGGRWDWEIYVGSGDEWRCQFGTLEALLDT